MSQQQRRPSVRATRWLSLDAVALAEALYDSTLGDSAFAKRWKQEQTQGGESRYGPRSRCDPTMALEGYAAEMAARSAVKMRRSREAAELLHSPAALAVNNDTRAAAARKALEKEKAQQQQQ